MLMYEKPAGDMLLRGFRSSLKMMFLSALGAQIDFPDTDTCSAAAMGKFVCRDYDGDNEELITGFVRSLDVAEQYPAAAMEVGLSKKQPVELLSY